MQRASAPVAVVTGAAGGLGAAVVRRLHAAGSVPVVADLDGTRAAKLAADIDGALAIEHDVTSEEGWALLCERVLAEFGRIDVLVNNAGTWAHASVLETSLADYRRVIEVNQTGVFLGIRAVLPAMIAAGAGSIVNIASIDAVRGAARMSAYCAAKHAVLGLTRAVALEVARHGIRVNAVSPGVMNTPMVETADPMALESVVGRIPLRRAADPDEVAKAVAYLASDASSYCLGTNLVVDGGWIERYL